MATIKAIKASSVHQIQSGQVIVDLNSVVKELVENSLDAGASSIEVRFVNNGLDSIVVQDNGKGIAPEDYESIALKHHTSKLASYDDLDSLSTFGFRGEALSSLCALSDFHVITAVAGSAAKGAKLDFDISGRLTGTNVVAAQKGTTVSVEKLFRNLPVRRKELEKNVKREYSKVLTLLQAYACVSTNVRFSVSNQVPKGKKTIAFATKSNPSTRENVANVFGAKTLSALIALDLELEMKVSTGSSVLSTAKRSAQSQSGKVRIEGHISKPVFGEGRPAPDKQMFFVNSRPCALPQVAKAFNEVYKSFNMSQSPFVFANLVMDTNAYDVNVSPDKRTILLHDQADLLDSLKESLSGMFEAQDQTMPASQLQSKKLPGFKQPTLLRADTSRGSTSDTESNTQSRAGSVAFAEFATADTANESPGELISAWAGRNAESRHATQIPSGGRQVTAKEQPKLPDSWSRQYDNAMKESPPGNDIGPMTPVQPELQSSSALEQSQSSLPANQIPSSSISSQPIEPPREVKDFNARLLSQQFKTPARPTRITTETIHLDDGLSISEGSASPDHDDEDSIRSIRPATYKSSPGPVQNAFDRMRPKRTREEIATVTIGDKTTTMVLGSSDHKRRRIHTPKMSGKNKLGDENSGFMSSLKSFAAPGTHLFGDEEEESNDGAENHSPQENEDDGSADMEADGTSDHVSPEGTSRSPSQDQSPGKGLFVEADDSDDEYLDEDDKKAREEAKVAQLIREAEEAAAEPTEETLRRASQAFRSSAKRKDSTLNLIQTLSISNEDLLGCELCPTEENSTKDKSATVSGDEALDSTNAEAKLSLTISKTDFAQMRIIGQFNLGFVLATRPASSTSSDPAAGEDHLFIIDQHAADEKFNFERLAATTTLTPQRLVTPKELQLSAVEQELITNNAPSLEANGFQIDVSAAADEGRNVHRLLTLPTSKETTFTIADLEELLHLLSEAPPSSQAIVRPSRVRRMLAMRACRSSIMVGRTLAQAQMEKVVRNMGGMDKPWNCPHGRPTMRHLAGLGGWEGGMGRREVVDWVGYLG
ncbi:DNA mismatch repair protein MutL [Myriangium duriaei CBS 260.36]|uniref:DNA mismatch repair protein PMS1 n=1 Tax=Myriangium duriaei CBS 260.36 TaxID=1168546 RepID=A0A9P4J3W1_9PEZI|nr:DNA mismatch repair protein MutL [Myriangium duriaei CBS 260.36]